MKEFFGFGGYQRPAEGFLSWQHLLFVSTLVVLMVILAVTVGKKYAKRPEKKKNFPLLIAAIAIDSIEIFRIVMICVRDNDPMAWIRMLPLFLCSIQLITIPLAALSHGRLKEAALDFVFIFGLLGALMGTYGAGQNYGCYPVLSIDNVSSGLTHTISGFSSIYIGVSHMTSMKKRNIPITFAILLGVCAAALIADLTIPYNYMFLMRGDGTPYDIFYNLVNGNPILYPILVVALFLLYIVAFYFVYFLVCGKKKKRLFA